MSQALSNYSPLYIELPLQWEFVARSGNDKCRFCLVWEKPEGATNINPKLLIMMPRVEKPVIDLASAKGIYCVTFIQLHLILSREDVCYTRHIWNVSEVKSLGPFQRSSFVPIPLQMGCWLLSCTRTLFKWASSIYLLDVRLSQWLTAYETNFAEVPHGLRTELFNYSYLHSNSHPLEPCRHFFAGLVFSATECSSRCPVKVVGRSQLSGSLHEYLVDVTRALDTDRNPLDHRFRF